MELPDYTTNWLYAKFSSTLADFPQNTQGNAKTQSNTASNLSAGHSASDHANNWRAGKI